MKCFCWEYKECDNEITKGIIQDRSGAVLITYAGPQRAASLFKERYPNAHHYEVELFGSLALTGKGHLTDYIIIETMKPKECVVLFKNRRELKHPNTMQLSAYDEADRLLGEWTVYSIGGGAIQIEGEKARKARMSIHTI